MHEIRIRGYRLQLMRPIICSIRERLLTHSRLEDEPSILTTLYFAEARYRADAAQPKISRSSNARIPTHRGQGADLSASRPDEALRLGEQHVEARAQSANVLAFAFGFGVRLCPSESYIPRQEGTLTAI
jgi:hypothetical protein